MNKILIIAILSMSIFNSCKEKLDKRHDPTPKVKVQLSKIENGYLPDYIQFSGKTLYLNNSQLIAPIGGYVTQVNIQQGDMVTKGDLLFEMQTPEAFIMQQKEKSSNNFGNIKIYAPVSGWVTSLNVTNSGVFADKGAVMCNIMVSKDLKIQANIPFEYVKYAKMGSRCKIVLPDNFQITGIFSKVLPQVDEASQTVKVLANITNHQFLPDNMMLRIFVDKSTKHKSQILPKNCIQTDALMTGYWVMKLINDSTAVQTFVTIGNQNHDKVEILSPLFKADDLFISEGAYGLSDTVLVNIQNN